MSVATTTYKATFNGNGSTETPYVCAFPTLDASHIKCLWTPAGSSLTNVLEPGMFTVAGVGDAEGFSVTTNPAIAVGDTLEIKRLVSPVQIQEFIYAAKLPAANFQYAIDYLTMCLQQFIGGDEAGARALLFPDGEPDSTNTRLPDASTRRGKWLGFSALDGSPELMDLSSILNLVNGNWLAVANLLSEIDALGQDAQDVAIENLGLATFSHAKKGLVPRPGIGTPDNYVLDAAGRWIAIPAIVGGSGAGSWDIPVLDDTYTTGGNTTNPPAGTPDYSNPQVVVAGINDQEAIDENDVSQTIEETNGASITTTQGGDAVRTGGTYGAANWSCPARVGLITPGLGFRSAPCGWTSHTVTAHLVTTATVTESSAPSGAAGQTISVDVRGYGQFSGELTTAPTTTVLPSGRHLNVYVMKKWAADKVVAG